MKTILAAVDFSPVSARVVTQAANLARALRARVVLLTVMVPPVFLKEYAPPPEALARVTVGNENAVRRALAAMERRLARKAVRAQSIILQGGPARLIVAQARKSEASYIVIGSHGHTAFYELIAGSTTQGVLKCARCPVLVIPPIAARARRLPG